MNRQELLKKISRRRNSITAAWKHRRDMEKYTDANELLDQSVRLSALECYLKQPSSTHYFDLVRQTASHGSPQNSSKTLAEVTHQSWNDDLALIAKFTQIQSDDLERCLPQARQPDKNWTTLKGLALGDCIISETRDFSLHHLADKSINLDLTHFYFSYGNNTNINLVETIKNHEWTIKHSDFLLLSLFTYTGILEYKLLKLAALYEEEKVDQCIDLCKRLIRDAILCIRSITEAPIILNTVSGLTFSVDWRAGENTEDDTRIADKPVFQTALDAINTEIRELAEEFSHIILVDETTLVKKYGSEKLGQLIIDRGPDKINAFHHTYFSYYLAQTYQQALVDFALARKKVIAVDFDNTLWDGVMAEGPVKHSTDRQKLLIALKNQGYLLVGISKNQEQAIRWSELEFIKPDDFVDIDLGWEQKPDRLKAIAEKLNLSPSSFVFIDDRDDECYLMKQLAPEVMTLSALDDSSWESLKRLSQKATENQTTESSQRTQYYQDRIKRNEFLETTQRETPYELLQLKASFRQASSTDQKKRAIELLQRTNQFNTNKRLNYEGALVDHDLYLCEASDRFGDLGNIVALMVKIEGKTATIESFCMSCRVIGYGLEAYAMAQLAQDLSTQGIDSIRGKLVKTWANEPCHLFFKKLSFQLEDDLHWIARIASLLLSLNAPNWINE